MIKMIPNCACGFSRKHQIILQLVTAGGSSAGMSRETDCFLVIQIVLGNEKNFNTI